MITQNIHPISARLPDDVYTRLLEEAAANERSVSGQIVFALRQYFAKQDRTTDKEERGDEPRS